MAEIDLGKAYQDFADLMAETGHSESAYCITLDVWNHRHGGPQVRVSLSAMLRPGDCEQIYGQTSLPMAFALMRARLEELKATRDGAETPMPLGVVAMPETTIVAHNDDEPF